MKIAITILIINTLIAVSCYETSQRSPISKVAEPNLNEFKLKVNCLKQMNIELIGLLSNKEALKKHLALSDDEIALIASGPQLKKKLSPNERDLIRKLIPKIADTTALITNCSHYNTGNVCKGDLALLSIYQVETFPFATALGAQWCVGDPISEDIHLPYNLIEYINYNRQRIQESYFAYFNSNGRIEYLREKGTR